MPWTRETIEALFAGSFLETLGYHLVERTPDGTLIGRLEHQPHLATLAFGVLHAGVLVGLADTNATFAVMYDLDPSLETDFRGAIPVCRKLEAQFLRPARDGMIYAHSVVLPQDGERADIRTVSTSLLDDESTALAIVRTTHRLLGVASR